MSRRNRSSNQRRARRLRLRLRRDEQSQNAPWAPPRWHLLGWSRRGDEARVDLDFRDQDVLVLDPSDITTDPDPALSLAQARRAWQMAGHSTRGEA